MAVDPTTLNPTEAIDQFTAFVLVPTCLRCGYAGFTPRRDGTYRCDRCVRIVVSVEHAPTVFNRRPSRVVRAAFNSGREKRVAPR